MASLAFASGRLYTRVTNRFFVTVNPYSMRTEKEKMLAGELYCSADEEIQRDHARAKALTYEFNSCHPSEEEKKQAVIRRLLVAKGSFYIEAPFNCDFGYNIEIGDNFYANYNCVILDVNKVVIGANTMLAPNVQIYSATHPCEPALRRLKMELGKPVTIGHDVWIGGGAIVCPGVSIGSNVTIGAGSVVCQDIPDNAIAAGNPCRVIRFVA